MARGIGDRQALLRSAGGVLLAVGCLVLLSRRSAVHSWSKFELMLLIAAPATLLYLLALDGAPRGASRAEAWRSVLLVTAILLAPVALFLLLDWVGASTKHLLYDAGVLLATAGVAIIGGRRAQAPVAFLLGGVALLIAWILLWVKIIHDPSADDVRWLLVIGGGLLLIGSSLVSAVADRGLGGTELAVAGGLGAVAGGVLGIFVTGFGAFAGLTGGFSSSSESTTVVESSGTGPTPGHAPPVIHERIISPAHSSFPGAPHISGGQSMGWDIYLLVVSLGLVLAGSRTKARGLGYVGVIGLLFFIESVGTQLSRQLAGHTPSTSLAGWPLVLVALGAVALAASWTRPGRPADGA